MTTVDDAARPSGLEALPTLPVFFKLAGRRVLVAGGDPPTAWKTELLAATGAEVVVVAADACADLRGQVEAGGGAVRLIARDWVDGDLQGAAIAVGSMADEHDAARRAGVPVNVIDKPGFCDFQFGTVVARAPLVVAITTDGAAPVLGQALRTRLEALLPQSLRAWAVAAKAWRPRVEARAWSFRRRRRFWETFARQALRPGGAMPDESAFQSCVEAALAEAEGQPARITLIGCGPGQPDALTFSAARALQDADLVFYDPDVAPETVALARREARKTIVPVGNGLPDHDLLEPGRAIAWIGTGDPLSCAHWAGRRQTLDAAPGLLSLERGLTTCPRCHGDCIRAPGRDGAPVRPAV